MVMSPAAPDSFAVIFRFGADDGWWPRIRRGASRPELMRFLSRQLSLPVSTMSQSTAPTAPIESALTLLYRRSLSLVLRVI